MEQEFVQDGFFQLLQQFRRIHWGGELEEMTQGEFMAMTAIRRGQAASPDKPGVYVSALADRLMISVSMVSKMLKTLEEKGWILRTIDPESRRNTFVSMTESGRALHDRELERSRALNLRVQETLGQDNLARFLTDAQALLECYAQELGTG
jgi:DNA-binding MarR family transcriptional regulator